MCRLGAFVSYPALLILLAFCISAATRPHYGGVLRVEVRQALETADPPQTGTGMAELMGAFNIVLWETGHRAVYAANENAASGRPFLDSVEVEMGRSLRDRTIDLDLGHADVVEFAPTELRRAPAGRKTWTSQPVRVVALVFTPRVDDVRVRQALALAVDRAAIHSVLLQRQGEISGALLPQWLSGYAFLFPAAADLARARTLIAGVPAAGRTLSLGVEDPAWQLVADRIALNARDAGLAVTTAPHASADVRLVEARVTSNDPAAALAVVAATLGLSEPPHTDSPESLYAAERAWIDSFRVVPLFHLPDVYGVHPRVRGGPGITPLGQWRMENLWLEAGRP